MRWALLGLALLVGCGTMQGYQKMHDTWTGQPVDQLISKRGSPRARYDLPYGAYAIEYLGEETYRYYPNPSGGGCRTVRTVERSSLSTGKGGSYRQRRKEIGRPGGRKGGMFRPAGVSPPTRRPPVHPSV
jgi:hypothetical protein